MDPAAALIEQEISRNSIINETIERGDSPVQQFYAGAVVLVTGASGFLGKQLIEKLLRSCAVNKIFVLLRPNKQKSVRERLAQLMEDPVYEYLRNVQPNFEQKVVSVSGDVTKPRLSISGSDWNTITEEVTIIFHGAATINFTDPLKIATMTNVHGTREMLLLAKRCKKLKSYVHISTAYAHATLMKRSTPVLEQFYKSPISPEVLIEIVDQIDERAIIDMTPLLIQGWPNTYSFTKAVAEEAVRTMAGDLPVCIIRPAIVICSYKEPAPGWVDRSCAFGPSGFILGTGCGILHVLYAKKSTNLDLVPVDIVNNAAIIAAHETAVRRERGDNDVRIYTVTGTKNPLTFGNLDRIIKAQELISDYAVWYAFAIITSSKFIFSTIYLFLHYIPAILTDIIFLMLGKKAILTKLYNKVYKLNDVLAYYMTTTWIFGDTNLRELYFGITDADRTIFNCTLDSLDWNLYITLWCIGCRKYILKDGLKNTKKGVIKQKWFKYLHVVTMFIYVYALYMFFYYLFRVISYFVNILIKS